MRLAAVLVVLVACRDKEATPPPPPTPPDASGFVHPPIDARVVEVAPTDWDLCKQALETAPKTAPMRRVQLLLNGCKPCGDWKPLLQWNKAPAEGGPTRDQIEDAMVACKAYCSPDAKQRFLGTLDKFRGTDSRGPWRFLGDTCKEQVSAVPDNRYASAPWFALDRIARAVADKPELAPLLDGFELPLPVISVSGYGYELAKSPVTAPDAGPLALTVTPAELRLAVVARAKLSKDGVVTLGRGEPYPGALIKTAKDLETQIGKLGAPIEQGSSIALFAPHGMAAVRLLDALAITGERPRPARPKWLTGDVRLAVQADGGPPGWALSGSIPVALRTTPIPGAIQVDLDDNPDPVIEKIKAEKSALVALAAKQAASDPAAVPAEVWKPVLAIRLGPKATVGALAKLIGAAVYFDVRSVALLKAPPKPPAAGSTK